MTAEAQETSSCLSGRAHKIHETRRKIICSPGPVFTLTPLSPDLQWHSRDLGWGWDRESSSIPPARVPHSQVWVCFQLWASVFSRLEESGIKNYSFLAFAPLTGEQVSLHLVSISPEDANKDS